MKTILPESSCIREERSVKSEEVYVRSSCIGNLVTVLSLPIFSESQYKLI